jgi:hypothetical protein
LAILKWQCHDAPWVTNQSGLAKQSEGGTLQDHNECMKALSFFSFLLLFSTLSALALQRPDLTGTVLTDGGKPLPDATIFIYTAGPKVGVGTL